MCRLAFQRYLPLAWKMLFAVLAGYGLLGLPSEMVADWDEINTTTFLQDAEQEDLLALLEIGLKPASPRQFAFLEKVVQLVGDNRLSRKMVEGTFVWARRQSGWSFPYFELALRMRARRAGIKI